MESSTRAMRMGVVFALPWTRGNTETHSLHAECPTADRAFPQSKICFGPSPGLGRFLRSDGFSRPLSASIMMDAAAVALHRGVLFV